MKEDGKKTKDRKLSIRMNSENVKLLQEKLHLLGFHIKDRKGFFDKGTRQAVEDFQKKHGLPPKGIADEQTIEAINNAAEAPKTISLKDLNADLKLKLPRKLLAYMEKRNIRTLEDVLKAGSISKFKGLPVPHDPQAVKMLEAHANLSILSQDIKTNEALIGKGYSSIIDIANRSRGDFIKDVKAGLGDMQAGQIYARALAQNNFLNNILTEIRADSVNGYISELKDIIDKKTLKDLFPAKCECRDCEAAVSPGAYLADLLDFAIKHLRNMDPARADNRIDLDFLVNTFHQPFKDMPVSCEAAQGQVRQVRICIEVLLRYLKSMTLTETQKAAMDTASRDFAIALYTMLLAKMGTSYEELRRVRGADALTRQSLADRLGIEPDDLGGLFLAMPPDPMTGSPQPGVITESALLRLFGWQPLTQEISGIQPFPYLPDRQRLHLYNTWIKEDYPDDPFSPRVIPGVGILYPPDALPVIDPDIIGPDDFRTPVIKNQPNNAFDIWWNRRRWIDEYLSYLKELKASHEPHGMEYILKVLRDPVPDFNLHLRNLIEGRDTQVTNDLIKALGLTVGSFTRLAAIVAKDKEAASDPHQQPVTDDEWQEVYSILTQAQKAKHYTSWKQDERSAGILPGTKDFWISIREPVQSTWQPVQRPPGQPWIDPDLVNEVDLPDSSVGNRAAALLKTRQDELAALCETLKSVRESDGFENLLDSSLGDPDPGLTWGTLFDSIKADLNSTQTAADEARARIRDELRMTEEEFTFLMGVRAKDRAGLVDPAKSPTAAEWAKIYTLLTRVHKEKFKLSAWRQEEDTSGSESYIEYYWQAMKMRLPLWRASAEARQIWQQALRDCSATPLIDPDLINTGDMQHPVAGDPAFELLQSRHSAIETSFNQLKAAREGAASDREGFEAILAGIPDEQNQLCQVSLSLEELEAAETQLKSGRDITARLEQLNLSAGAFSYLLWIHNLIENGESVLDSEWDDVYNILIRVQKRSIFAKWRMQEREKQITLSSRYFKIPEADTSQETISLPKWRAAWQERYDWLDTLRSRDDQEKAVGQALQAAISSTEEATLPKFRDDLINVLNEDNIAPEIIAKRLSDQLLIDMQSGGCRMTTRIAQAIETIQSVLWSARTGLLKDTYQYLELDGDNFDEQWKGIGSYSTWRAAMFVFLYPENILMPTLRSHQTPGFMKIVEMLNSGPQVTATIACEAARGYSEYFRDVCSLILEASCQSRTRINVEQGCRKQASDEYRDLFYMFARSSETNRVYWSAYDPEDRSGFAQSFWEEIESLKNVISIVGAAPYQLPSTNSHFIFLFAYIKEEGKEKLKFIKYDLEERKWDTETSELSLPSEEKIISIVLPQYWSLDRLFLFIKTDERLYKRSLNSEGSGWEANYLSSEEIESLRTAGFNFSNEWDYFRQFYFPVLSNIRAAFYDRHGLHVISDIKDHDKIFVYRLDSNTSDTLEHQYDGRLVGSFLWPCDDYGANAYILYKDSSGMEWISPSTENYYTEYATLSGHSYLVPKWGEAPSDKRMFAYRWDGQDFGGIYCILEKRFDTFFEKRGNTIACKYTGPFDMTIPSKQVIQQAFSANAGAQESVLTYLEEKFYFLPMYVALQLQHEGEYAAALDWFRTVYNFSLPREERNIYSWREGDSSQPDYMRALDWLLDPLNPHAIAATRHSAYTRFTIMSIVRCLLEYADSEFTYDTGESIQRAQFLYNTALDLLDEHELKQHLNDCEELIGTLNIEVGDPQWKVVLEEIKHELAGITDRNVLALAIGKITPILQGSGTWESRFEKAKKEIASTRAKQHKTASIAGVLEKKATSMAVSHKTLLAQPKIAQAAAAIGVSLSNPNVILTFVPAPSYTFCIPPNPVLYALRRHAELNLFKLSNCYNIAGMKRQLEPYSSPNDTRTGLPIIGVGGSIVLPGAVSIQPTQYRYSVLVERAKHLVSLAQQIESSFLSTLEKKDQEQYSLLKARQDVRQARAGVQLQEQRVREAMDGVELAKLQREKYVFIENYYDSLVEQGLLLQEQAALLLLGLAAASSFTASAIYFTLGGAGMIAAGAVAGGIIGGGTGTTVAPESGGSSVAGGAAAGAVGGSTLGAAASLASGGVSNMAAGFSSLAAGLSTTASVLQTWASYERRRQEWEFQRDVAYHDIRIGDQQVKIARDQVDVVEKERAIAKMQTEHAEAIVDFLSNKFLNTELYEWMSGVLKQVYRYFLQQATAMAKLAQNQLAFERQEIPQSLIKFDYWLVQNSPNAGGTNENSPDRRGLTGSARLMQDIYQLDQYAFQTDKRKLQLTRTISLARLDPYAFARFCETGVMTFATPMNLFDRDFPGHYLRLIKRVRTSVIALIPPAQGIQATLSTTGISRVVIGGDIFQTTVVRRDPESVALTSPVNATGLFELNPQPEMMLPFEGTGIDTTWQFVMPKAANLLDYRTIADVLITVEYTALYNPNYRQQVIQEMDNKLSSDRIFSFRHNLPDLWYDLHNPDQSRTPMLVSFITRREDFQPNIEELKIEHVMLYFVRNNSNEEIPVTHLFFTEQGTAGTTGGGANTVDGIISTRRVNGSSWISMTENHHPFGIWEMALPDTNEIRDLFKNEQIEDILFVITYSGRTPEWPV